VSTSEVVITSSLFTRVQYITWCDIARPPSWYLPGKRTRTSFAYKLFACNKYVGPPYCQAEMYAGSVTCCPLVSYDEYADRTDRRTDGRTPDRYVTLSVIDAASMIKVRLTRVLTRGQKWKLIVMSWKIHPFPLSLSNSHFIPSYYWSYFHLYSNLTTYAQSLPSRSVQPFLHSLTAYPTHRQTHRPCSVQNCSNMLHLYTTCRRCGLKINDWQWSTCPSWSN